MNDTATEREPVLAYRQHRPPRAACLVDVAVADDLKRHPKITAIEGSLPEELPELDGSAFDVGEAVLNVPSWRGKRFLELSAFRLGTSPPEEMDDHKASYDPRDLWPMLVRAGFRPRLIRCDRHKFGLNKSAVCRRDRKEEEH